MAALGGAAKPLGGDGVVLLNAVGADVTQPQPIGAFDVAGLGLGAIPGDGRQLANAAQPGARRHNQGGEQKAAWRTWRCSF